MPLPPLGTVVARTLLTPTWVSPGQVAISVPGSKWGHWATASGLTLRPGGRSTRIVFRLPLATGRPTPVIVCLTMIWVKPEVGCPAAWVKKSDGVLEEQGSALHVPAWKPAPTASGSPPG